MADERETEPLGSLPLESVRAFIGWVNGIVFETAEKYVSEEDCLKLATGLAEALDDLDVQRRPLKEGEILLTPDEAQEVMLRIFREAANNALREIEGDS